MIAVFWQPMCVFKVVFLPVASGEKIPGLIRPCEASTVALKKKKPRLGNVILDLEPHVSNLQQQMSSDSCYTSPVSIQKKIKVEFSDVLFLRKSIVPA